MSSDSVEPRPGRRLAPEGMPLPEEVMGETLPLETALMDATPLPLAATLPLGTTLPLGMALLVGPVTRVPLTQAEALIG